MKIGIDISQIVYPGGVGVYTRNLVANLLKIDKKNQYLLFGASLRKQQQLKQFFLQLRGENLQKKFSCLPTSLTEFLFNDLRWPKIEFFTGKIDIFHTSDWTEPKSACPKITTVHDLAPLSLPKKHHPKIVSVFKRKLELVRKESDLIIAVSQSTKKDLIKKLGIKEKRIKVVYEALSQEFEQAKTDNSLVKKHNLKNFIISDAIRNPRKNLENLLLAFGKVKTTDLKLVLTGESMWHKEEMRRLIDNSPERERIIWLGRISQGRLKALYQQARSAIFPSLYEGFGIPVLEAMSCGCPVITSSISSLPEVAGKAAILVNPYSVLEIGQAIDKMLNNQVLAGKLIKRGLGQIKKFSWEKTVEQTLKIYRQCF